ncbi:MAG: indolepyruvate oxidoreductase subunit beta family protein [Burkholderiales bacterium]|nr:indolepyruvate oxidoreductase subunit beta family protein [Burkholderiales bacterium]
MATDATRPITILVAALGGEGGGVLADWLRDAATAAGLPVQSTSIPGVAQRTGATTYYLEIFPVPTAQLGGRRPVLALTPTPGNVDLMVASELVEAGRALQNGWVTARTALIASSHRIYATVEKMPMGDGRYAGERILAAAREVAGRAILFDMADAAQKAGTVISAVMFGALAGSARLPLSREQCEAAIRASGKGVEASLRGFAAGFAAAGSDVPAAAPAPVAPPVVARTQAPGEYDAYPVEAREVVAEGVKRMLDYQDRAYADLYLRRLQRLLARSKDAMLITETARYLALWMSFEDVIRVADLKTRKSRFERVRSEVLAKPHEPAHFIEFLKPGLDEIAGLMPPALSRRFHAWAIRRGLADRLSVGMHIKSNSVSGFLLLRSMAGLRFWRRRSARYADEQALIERWLAAIEAAAAHPRLAFEIAMSARLIKGYSDTHKRGRANLLRILDNLVDKPTVTDPDERAKAVFAAREAALADPEGRGLDASLGRHGIAPRPPQEHPLRFVRPARRNS